MGSGFIWKALRHDWPVAEYVGLDVKPKKGRLKIDSARFLAAGGWAFDVVDVDTYGSPWKHWEGVLQFMPQACTCFLTIGFIRAAGGGILQNEAKQALGIYGMRVPPGITGAMHEISVSYCLARCYDYGILPIEVVEAASTGTARYIGLRLERQP
jgi:hypothetical protein